MGPAPAPPAPLIAIILWEYKHHKKREPRKPLHNKGRRAEGRGTAQVVRAKGSFPTRHGSLRRAGGGADAELPPLSCHRVQRSPGGSRTPRQPAPSPSPHRTAPSVRRLPRRCAGQILRLTVSIWSYVNL